MLKFRLVLAAGASLPLAAFAVLGSSQPDSVARTLLAGCQLASVETPPFVYGADPGGQTGGPRSYGAATFRVKFFASAAADPFGHGAGQFLLGYTTVMTDGSGNGSFAALLPFTGVPSAIITATATAITGGNTAADPAFGGTSEFSAAITTRPGTSATRPPMKHLPWFSFSWPSNNTPIVEEGAEFPGKWLPGNSGFGCCWVGPRTARGDWIF